MLLTSVCPHCIVSLPINQVGVDFRRNWVMRQVIKEMCEVFPVLGDRQIEFGFLVLTGTCLT